MTRQPSLFIGHGAPLLAIDPDKGAPLRTLGATLRPHAMIVVSAHWLHDAPATGVEATAALYHDYRGFPPALHRVTYPAPGAPDLAARVRALTGAPAAPSRPWDHGVWTPLVHLFPAADVPLLQVALPNNRQGAWDLGTALRPLRDEGVLLIGSGNITHNLGDVGPEGGEPRPAYVAFDRWVAERVDAHDLDALRVLPDAPHLRTNHPHEDHLWPLLFAAGAAYPDEPVSYPVQGWEFSNLSRRAVRWG